MQTRGEAFAISPALHGGDTRHTHITPARCPNLPEMGCSTWLYTFSCAGTIVGVRPPGAGDRAWAETYLGDADAVPGTSSMLGELAVGTGKWVPSFSTASPPLSTSLMSTVG